MAKLRGSSPTAEESVQRALGVRASNSGSVQHVVFLMQENRSFDHYFGKFKGVAGFDDTNNSAAFTQAWTTANGGSGAPAGEQPPNVLLPFHMSTIKGQAECTYDLSHAWPAEHACWNDGAMDSFVSTHTSPSYENQLGTNTMGFYNQYDIPFYYKLAENFTICDNYHCSVFGPTHPNRLMAISANLDPAGVAGGPIIVTNSNLPPYQGTCTWETMPDVLTEAGVTWKCYNPYGSSYQPGSGLFISKNMLLYFDQYANADTSSAAYQNAFSYYGPNVVGGLTSKNPNIDDFTADVANGTLPQVSWIISPDSYDEHPPAPAQLGEWYTQKILDTLTSNPDVWENTVLFIMYWNAGRVPDRRPPAVFCRWDRRADWPWRKGADVGGVPVLQRWMGLLGHVRSHVPAQVHRDDLQCRCAEPDSVARLNGGRLDDFAPVDLGAEHKSSESAQSRVGRVPTADQQRMQRRSDPRTESRQRGVSGATDPEDAQAGAGNAQEDSKLMNRVARLRFAPRHRE
jgi:phospholipase C